MNLPHLRRHPGRDWCSWSRPFMPPGAASCPRRWRFSPGWRRPSPRSISVPGCCPGCTQHIATMWLAIAGGLCRRFPGGVHSARLSSASVFPNSCRSSPIGPLDRVLGIVFGVVRGLVIVGLAYIGVYQFRAGPRPACLAHPCPHPAPDAENRRGAAHPWFPNDDQGVFAIHPRDALGDLIRRNEEPVKLENAGENTQLPEDHMPHPSISAARGEKGYGAKDRRALDSLVEATGNGGSGKP